MQPRARCPATAARTGAITTDRVRVPDPGTDSRPPEPTSWPDGHAVALDSADAREMTSSGHDQESSRQLLATADHVLTTADREAILNQARTS